VGSGNILDLHSGDTRFEYRLENRLSTLSSFLQSLQANFGVVVRVDNVRIFLSPFQSINYESSFNSPLQFKATEISTAQYNNHKKQFIWNFNLSESSW
jgi:hypothetical protein